MHAVAGVHPGGVCLVRPYVPQADTGGTLSPVTRRVLCLVAGQAASAHGVGLRVWVPGTGGAGLAVAPGFVGTGQRAPSSVGRRLV